MNRQMDLKQLNEQELLEVTGDFYGTKKYFSLSRNG